MNKALLLLTTLFFGTLSGAFEPHTANYQLSINGLKIAEEVRTLHQIEGGYFYTANAKTSGIAALVKDYSIAASSTFTLNTKGVDSSNYQIMEQEDKKISKNYAIDISSSGGSITSILTKTQPKVKTWKAKKGNIADPLSVFLAISFDIKNNPKQLEFSYQIADGKSVEKRTFKKTNNQKITLNNQQFNAIKVERVDSKDNNIKAYFLSEYQYLPVLIQQTKGGRDYAYEMSNFKLSKIENYK